MRIFISVLVLIFSIQSWAKTDGISEFEIEGMRVGDSLLDFFSKEEIENTKKYYWENKKFAGSRGWLKNQDFYEAWQAYYKSDDVKYIIHYITVSSAMNNNLEECNKRKNIIVEEGKNKISNAKFIDLGKIINPADVTKKSLSYKVRFDFKDGSGIMVTCTDFSEEMEAKGYGDNISVEILSAEFKYFLTNEAYQ